MKTSTEQDYRRRVAEVIVAMAIDPSAPHTVESLAATARFSPFHFHRLYRSMTGEGIAATRRRLRLSRAAHRLMRTRSVTDAALDAGYETPQSFARAFRTLTGLSPTGFLARTHDLDAPAPTIGIVERQPTAVWGFEHVGPAATIPHTYARLRQWAEAHKVMWPGPVRIGIGTGDPELSGGFAYRAGLVLPDGPDGGDLRCFTAPGGRFAAHRLVGPYALIGPTIQALIGRWLPRSGLVADNRPTLELYHGPFPRSGSPVTDLLIPIRETPP